MLCFPASVDECSFGVCKEGKEGILINKHKLISYYKFLRFIFFKICKILIVRLKAAMLKYILKDTLTISQK